jgi:hypothetical protein
VLPPNFRDVTAERVGTVVVIVVALCGRVPRQGQSAHGKKWKPQPNGKVRLGSGNRALSSGKCDGGAASQSLQVMTILS